MLHAAAARLTAFPTQLIHRRQPEASHTSQRNGLQQATSATHTTQETTSRPSPATASATSRTEHSQAHHRPITSSAPTFCLQNVSLSNNAASTHQHQRQRQRRRQRHWQRHYPSSPFAILQASTSAHNRGNISDNQRSSNNVPASPLNSSCKLRLQQATPPPRPEDSDGPINTATTPLQQRQEPFHITSQLQSQSYTDVNLPEIIK
jgi:hypothetical protein